MAAMIDFIFGLLDATGLELMFGISALIGGVLFLLWLVLVVVLGGIGDVAEGVFGIDIDAMGADASFKALTFQGVMAFMMFFGLSGLYTLKSDGGDTLAIGVGGVAGLASMYGTGKIFQLFFSLEASGNIEMEQAIGEKGSVYLRIPEGDVGQVTIEVGGAQKTYNAKSEDGQGIATGEFIEVVDIISSTLIVKRV